MDCDLCTLGGQLPQPFPAPVFCDLCQIWLNGQSQWEEHVVGRKHRTARARLQPQSFQAHRGFRR
eukprot:4221120-Lingulodinium_polyedra.AAC.1